MTTILALDLGTTTGWAVRAVDGAMVSGSQSFRAGAFRRRRNAVSALPALADRAEIDDRGLGNDLLRGGEATHAGVDAAHAYGGFLATLTAWCEHHEIPYSGVPVGTIKRHVTGKGNANKEQMLAAVRALGFAPADDNEADALALLAWAVSSAGATDHAEALQP